MNKLAALNSIESRIAKVETLDEAKGIRDQAEALRIYAKSVAAGLGVQNRAARIKILAEHRAGEIVSSIPRAQGKDKLGLRSTLDRSGIAVNTAQRWELISKVPESEIMRLSEIRTEEGEELTSSEIIELSKQKVEAVRRAKAAEKAEKVEGFTKDFQSLYGRNFRCVYVDPPWAYSNQATRASTSNHYDSLTVDQIAQYRVDQISDKSAHLHLWTTNAFLFECPRLFEAWGFEFKSSFIWVKPTMGIGNYWRNSHEILLTAVKGGLVSQDKSQMSWMECGRGAHSEKPDGVRERIEKLSPGPRLEMFGRRAVPGWMVFGNEITEML